MKIFAAGVATETNTFSPVPTGLEDFLVQRGRVSEAQSRYASLDLSTIWGRRAKARGDDFVFSLMAWAEPSGITVRSAYEALRDEILHDLRAAMPVDVALLMLHGAMVAQGYDDCEEDLIRKVRGIVGDDAVIGVELDLHCHLTPSKIACADVVITYKEYPHVDVNDRAEELFTLAIGTKLGNIRPRMALFDCRMIGLYPTSRPPLRQFVDAMSAAEGREQVLSISFGHGFQFADNPYAGAKVLAVTNNDLLLAERVAEEFGVRAHALRREIGFETLSLPMEKALSRALASDKTPVVVADQSDNTGGGAPGDATFALRWLLDHQVANVAMAILYDPEVVRIAKKAGTGAILPMRIGGKLGPHSGDPVDLEVRVLSIRNGYVHELSQQSGGAPLFAMGDFVALHGNGIDIVASSVRCQCFSPVIFSDFGIDPKSKRLLVVKSVQHFYAAFAPMAGEVIYMTTSGAVSADPKQIAYRRLDTDNMYPWVSDPTLAHSYAVTSQRRLT